MRRKPGRLAFFRVELHADQIVAADRRRHRPAILDGGEHMRRVGAIEADRSARNRHARPARCRRTPDARARNCNSFQPICGILSAGSDGVSFATSPAIQPSPAMVSNSRPRVAISCMPTQMPRNGLPPLMHLLVQRLDHAGQGGEAAPAIGEGADAGQHDAVGGARPSPRRWSPRSRPPDAASRAARSSALAAERRLPEP